MSAPHDFDPQNSGFHNCHEQIIGYHSNRRVPDRKIVDKVIIPLYRNLLAEEQRHANRKDGQQAGTEMVVKLLQDSSMQYDEFVARL